MSEALAHIRIGEINENLSQNRLIFDVSDVEQDLGMALNM